MSHTPGPWTIRAERAKSECYALIDAPTWGKFARVVVRFNDAEEDDRQGWSNANLIVAAPDLLAVCKAFVAKLGPDGYYPEAGAPLTAQMRAAIARAEGKSEQIEENNL